jgi:hypothetical protein
MQFRHWNEGQDQISDMNNTEEPRLSEPHGTGRKRGKSGSSVERFWVPKVGKTVFFERY